MSIDAPMSAELSRRLDAFAVELCRLQQSHAELRASLQQVADPPDSAPAPSPPQSQTELPASLPPAPTPAMPATRNWRALWLDAFLRYNPLPFFSAACVLAGIAVLSPELTGDATALFMLSLLGQAYEAALLASMWFLLHRLQQPRPAVFLGLCAALLLADPTFRVETHSSFGLAGLIANGVWLALLVGKSHLLALLSGVRLPGFERLLPLVCGLGMLVLPYMLALYPAAADVLRLLLVWLAGLLIAGGLASLASPAWCSRPLDAWGQTVLQRCRKALVVAWPLLLLLHVLASLTLLPSSKAGHLFLLLTPLCLLLATQCCVQDAWRCLWLLLMLLLQVLVRAQSDVVLVLINAAGILPALLWTIHRQRLPADYHLFSVASAVLLLWSTPWLQSAPVPPDWLLGLAGLPVLWLAIARDAPLARLLTLAGLLWAGVQALRHAPEHATGLWLWLHTHTTALAWGSGLLATGFVVLALAVWLHWQHRSRTP